MSSPLREFGRRAFRCAGLAAWLLASSAASCHAQAQESSPPVEATSDGPAPPTLTADPNAPQYALEYRGSIRGRFGDSLEIYGDRLEAGYRIAIAPFVELHEPRGSDQVLPSQYWRARLALDQSYGFTRRAHLFRVSLVLSHESDHETAHLYSTPGFLALNDLALGFSFASHHGIWAWHGGAAGRVFFLSCTAPSRPCENFRGDSSLGGQLDFTVAVPGPGSWRIAPFAAASASGILAHELVRSERRLSTRLGVYARFHESVLSVFLLGWLGNDVGVARARSMRVVGIGASFAR